MAQYSNIMPRGKQYRKTRQYSAGIRYQNKAIGKIGADVKYLKTVVNSELHYFIVTTSDNIDSTGTLRSLNDVALGDGASNRTGTSILPRYQTINVHVNKSLAGAAPDHETIRMMVFRYWGEQTSASDIPAVSEVLNTLDPLSFLSEDNTGSRGDRERRIEVHKSKIFTLDKVAQTSRTYKLNIQLNGMNKNVKDHIKYRESGVNPYPVSGGFFILFISDNATGSNKSSFNYNSKMSFHDN